MTVTRTTILIAVAAVALSGGGWAWGKAEVQRDVEVEAIDVVILHPCAEEEVHIVGEARYTTHLVRTENGGVHLVVHIEAQAEGIGLQSGDRYRAIGTSNSRVNVNANNEQMSGTGTSRERFIGQGQAPNGWLELTIRNTVNANGDVTVAIQDYVIGCQ